MGEYKLSNYYHGELSIANQTISEAAEEEMLKNMSPRDQERYKIAKRSPDGYMAAYKGAKASMQIDEDLIEDREWLSKLISLTEENLPEPLPKKLKKVK